MRGNEITGRIHEDRFAGLLCLGATGAMLYGVRGAVVGSALGFFLGWLRSRSHGVNERQ